MTQPAQPVLPAQEPDPRPRAFGSKRNLAMSLVMVALLLLLAVGQWLTIQAGQDVARALTGSARTGPVDIQYKGMGFSRDHVLVARYDIAGIANVSTARWHARPWGRVELAP